MAAAGGVARGGGGGGGGGSGGGGGGEGREGRGGGGAQREGGPRERAAARGGDAEDDAGHERAETLQRRVGPGVAEPRRLPPSVLERPTKKKPEALDQPQIETFFGNGQNTLPESREVDVCPGVQLCAAVKKEESDGSGAGAADIE